jgi:hypothetical protein
LQRSLHSEKYSEIYCTNPHHAKALMMMTLKRCKCIAQVPSRRCDEFQVT